MDNRPPHPFDEHAADFGGQVDGRDIGNALAHVIDIVGGLQARRHFVMREMEGPLSTALGWLGDDEDTCLDDVASTMAGVIARTMLALDPVATARLAGVEHDWCSFGVWSRDGARWLICGFNQTVEISNAAAHGFHLVDGYVYVAIEHPVPLGRHELEEALGNRAAAAIVALEALSANSTEDERRILGLADTTDLP